MSTDIPLTIEERRKHGRVMDAIGLEYHVVDANSPSCEGYDVERRSRVRVANKYDLTGYAEVKRDYPDIADYIDRLEERIRQLLVGGDQLAEQPTHTVSLSFGGIAFSDARHLTLGDIIRMKITLFPEMTRFTCEGTLVNAEDISERKPVSEHYYRVNFNEISERALGLIENHITQLKNSMPISVDND